MRLHALIALVFVLLFSTVAYGIDVTIDEVEVDDTTLQPNAANRLSVERDGNELEVRVEITSRADLEDVQISGELSGYEHGVISDTTPVFDTEANVSYVKKLRLLLPSDMEGDNYKLRIDVSDRFSEQLTREYNLLVELPRNAITIKFIDFNPDVVRAGSATVGKVRVRNTGERDQEDIRVTMSIPLLGVSDTKYIEEIEGDDEEEETEEFFLRIPKCADPGVYEVRVEADFSDGHRQSVATRTVTVLEDNTCHKESASQKITITLGQQLQNVNAGETAIYPITITNPSKTAKTFILSTQTPSWADVSISPTSTVLVPAGQMHTAYVNVVVGEDAPVGAHSIMTRVKTGEQTHELSMTANISQSQKGIKNVFEIVLVALVVILIVLGIIIGINRFRNDDDVEKYY